MAFIPTTLHKWGWNFVYLARAFQESKSWKHKQYDPIDFEALWTAFRVLSATIEKPLSLPTKGKANYRT